LNTTRYFEKLKKQIRYTLRDLIEEIWHLVVVFSKHFYFSVNSSKGSPSTFGC